MVIIGAGGLAKEILDVFHRNGGTQDLSFFDDVNPDARLLYDTFPVIKSWSDLEEQFARSSPDFVIGVGGAKTRHQLAMKAISCGGRLRSIISVTASIGQFGTTLGNGVCVLSQAVVTCDVTVGEGTLIYSGAGVFHNAKVGDYCQLSPGAKILGRVSIGEFTEIGANAVVLPDVTVGSHCRVGAGAVVTRDVPSNSTVVGIPAKPLQLGNH